MEFKTTENTTYNKAIVAKNIALSNTAISLKQLQHRIPTCVNSNVTNKYFGWHRSCLQS